MTLDQAKRKAQSTADFTQTPCVVLNLNRVGAAMYVVRDFHPFQEAEPNRVAGPFYPQEVQS